jgi:hypothetical protein
VDPRTDLDGVEERKFLTLPGLEQSHSVLTIIYIVYATELMHQYTSAKIITFSTAPISPGINGSSSPFRVLASYSAP